MNMEFPGGSGRRQQQQQHLEQHLPPMTPLPLARQGSVYSLTFHEFQSALGGPNRDFGSMNMDELLRSIWTAEESQAMGAANAPAAAIQRQGSLTLPRTLSQKTVDEVWRDVMCFGGPSAAPIPPTQRQQTLGEITLEEFLVRSGVVREDMTAGQPAPTAPPPPPPPTSQPHMLFPQSNVFAPLVPPLNLGNGLVTGGGGAASMLSPVRPLTSNGFGKMEGEDLSSPVPYVFNGGLSGRKPSAIGKVAERRQRRMIKNRESAARSRERKQTYMMELEEEVAKLKELNEELQKKQVEMLEEQKNKVLERMTRQVGPTAKRICLRRTLTGPW